jgi:flavin reductase (DIM6/NTAB) family NADH-FMN oxidoreductase RutF
MFRPTRRIFVGAIMENSAPMNFDSRQFRNSLSRFATGVTIVTCIGEDGAPHGVTVNSFSSVSLAPPLVLFNLDLESRSLEIFRAASGFSINVLAAGQVALSRKFAETGMEKWDDVGWREGATGAPNLDGALACSVG